jgi:hypothetical protein
MAYLVAEELHQSYSRRDVSGAALRTKGGDGGTFDKVHTWGEASASFEINSSMVVQVMKLATVESSD